VLVILGLVFGAVQLDWFSQPLPPAP